MNVPDLGVAREVADYAQLLERDVYAAVSHELRTPMTVILGNASTLATGRDSLDSGQRAQVIGDVQCELTRLNEVLGDLLTLARFDNGLRVTPEYHQAGVLFGEVAADFALSHHRTVDAAVDDVAVQGDAECLAGVLKNLLSNADKYSPADSTIEVYVRGGLSECRITVLDRGIGIPPDEPELLFGAFFRSERVRGTVRGLGLGLTVCRRVVEAHAGRIWAEPRDGGGSAFSFVLPAAATAA